MNRNSRNGGKKPVHDKTAVNSDEVNARNIRTLCDYLLHEFVRCHLKNGAVYCGFVKAFSRNFSFLELYCPYIEQSPIHHDQPKEKEMLRVDFQDI